MENIISKMENIISKMENIISGYIFNIWRDCGKGVSKNTVNICGIFYAPMDIAHPYLTFQS